MYLFIFKNDIFYDVKMDLLINTLNIFLYKKLALGKILASQIFYILNLS